MFVLLTVAPFGSAGPRIPSTVGRKSPAGPGSRFTQEGGDRLCDSFVVEMSAMRVSVGVTVSRELGGGR